MKDIVDHLRDKVETVNLNNPKANPGSKLLKDHVHRIMEFVMTSLDTIGTHYNKYDEEFPYGYARLTTVSTAIGREVCRRIGLEHGSEKPKEDFRNHLRIGDCILDSIIVAGYSDLIRGSEETEARIAFMTELKKLYPDTYKEHPEYNVKLLNVPYALRATNKWSSLKNELTIDRRILMGTSFLKPKMVGTLFQNTETGPRSLIKGWDKEYISLFNDNDMRSSPFVKGINTIQQTAWGINQDVLEAVKRQFSTILYEEGEMPEEGDPSEVKIALSKLIKDDNAETQEAYNEATRKWNKKLLVLRARSKNYALKTILNKAEVIGTSVFWQFADCDYRGRLYFVEPYLNFQGNDLARGLMMFADGKPIGEEGIKWLAIHTATCYNQSYEIDKIPDWVTADYKGYLKREGLRSISVDKMSLQDRARWTYNNLVLINSTAQQNLIHGEKPFSFLAACIEMIHVQNDGAEHITFLPIPIDGSNNGWQHLAAISKDQQAGELVSLVDTEIQSDFYVKVAKELHNVVKEEGNTRLTTLIESMPMRDIRKGIAKRAAMTRAYSCGAKRMSVSMYADCYKEGYTEKYGITMIDCIGLSQYIIKAIDKVCPGPLATMAFLQEAAVHQVGYRKEIDDKNVHLQWWTPSEFLVIYQRNRQEAIKHRGRIAGKQIKHVGRVDTHVPDIGAYISGISPNFIHSQDAAHLMLVAADWEGSFGAVHDSFSTHACDVDKLGQLVRNYFVRLYDYENFFTEIKEALLSEPEGFEAEVPIGSLNVNDVYDSKYFFC
jgi:DNA-directed RNA polymerase, mitochondrial